MKYLFAFVMFSQLAVFSQSNVDKLAKQLEELGNFTFSDWKISENLSAGTKFEGNPYDIKFDDSQWKTISSG